VSTIHAAVAQWRATLETLRSHGNPLRRARTHS
jgi:hypothetical protein